MQALRQIGIRTKLKTVLEIEATIRLKRFRLCPVKLIALSQMEHGKGSRQLIYDFSFLGVDLPFKFIRSFCEILGSKHRQGRLGCPRSMCS